MWQCNGSQLLTTTYNYQQLLTTANDYLHLPHEDGDDFLKLQ